MKNKSLEVIEKEYCKKYGHLPLDKELLMKYIEENYKLDLNKIEEEKNYIQNIEWNKISFIIPVVPKPSPRPRYSFKTTHFYVMGANTNKQLMKKYLEENHIIFTRTHFKVLTYQPTPISQMNATEIYLAEVGLIEAMVNPDWDNLGKTYSDMVQGILIVNDNIASKGIIEKFYSIRPRVEIEIAYQMDFDSKYNKNRMTKSKTYLEAQKLPIFEDYTTRKW